MQPNAIGFSGLEPLPRQPLAAIVYDYHFKVSPSLSGEGTDTIRQLGIRCERWNGDGYLLLRQDLILTRGWLTLWPNPVDLAVLGYKSLN